MKRQEVLAILREQKERESKGKESAFFLGARRVDENKVAIFRKREHIQMSSLQPSHHKPKDLISKTPPPLQRSLSNPPVLRIPEYLLYYLDVYIKGSFDSGAWKFAGNEFLIESSPFQSMEQKSCTALVGGFETACANFASGRPDIGGLYWRAAFREIETLVRGSYYDIIPNIIQKVIDIHRKGHHQAALMMLQQVAQSSLKYLPIEHVRTSIFRALGQLDLDQLTDLEGAIMARFVDLFDLYLGSRCYNTFVVRIDTARRRIQQGGLSYLDDLPVLSNLDETFGPSNRRPLEVILVRTETLYQYQLYEQVEIHASALIQRAAVIEGDVWQRTYSVTKGQYFAGLSQYALGNFDSSEYNMLACLETIKEFEQVDSSGLFNLEKLEMLERLEVLATQIGDMQKAAEWRAQMALLVGRVAATDSV